HLVHAEHGLVAAAMAAFGAAGVHLHEAGHAIELEVASVADPVVGHHHADDVPFGDHLVAGRIHVHRHARVGRRQLHALAALGELFHGQATGHALVLGEHHPVRVPHHAVVAVVAIGVLVPQGGVVEVRVRCQGQGHDALGGAEAHVGRFERGGEHVTQHGRTVQLTGRCRGGLAGGAFHGDLPDGGGTAGIVLHGDLLDLEVGIVVVAAFVAAGGGGGGQCGREAEGM